MLIDLEKQKYENHLSKEHLEPVKLKAREASSDAVQ